MTDPTTPATVEERTVAFFVDPRASSLLLAETVEGLINSLGIQRALIDLSAVPGLVIASAFERAGLPFDSLEFGQEDHLDDAPVDRHPVFAPVVASDADRIREAAAGIHEIQVSDFGSIDANIVVVPAMVAHDEALLDFSQGSIVGAVLTQAEATARDLVLIDTPERGLRPQPDGSYTRSVVHIGATSDEA